MIEKTFISASELLHDSFMLGRKIIESGFRPDFIVGVWALTFLLVALVLSLFSSRRAWNMKWCFESGFTNPSL